MDTGSELLALLRGAHLAALLVPARRFARRVLVAAGAPAVTGVLQTLRVTGNLPSLRGTAQGRGVMLKLALFAALLGMAAATPRLVPRLTHSSKEKPARWRLRTAIGVQMAIGLAAVFAAAGALAAPPGAQQPLWPFPWRPDLALMNDPDIRLRVALALAAAGAGFASLAAGLVWRRRRRVLMAAGAILLAMASPSVRLVLVEAYPTSYHRSPTGFATASIVRGAAVFAANCAPCHGAQGRGDGESASQLTVRPADLTAPHLWRHSDGDLFWWIATGRAGPDGAPVMPGFASSLSETDRWSVIDFVRANNAGASLRSAGGWIAPLRAPALPVICAGLPADTMQGLRGSVVRVIASGDVAASAPHPPPIPPQEGHAVVTLHLTRITPPADPPAPGECIAASGAAWDAYATLAGLPPHALPGAEFLVDPDGWLRSAWLPGADQGWRTPDQLIAQVRLICTHPIANATGGAHDLDH